MLARPISQPTTAFPINVLHPARMPRPLREGAPAQNKGTSIEGGQAPPSKALTLQGSRASPMGVFVRKLTRGLEPCGQQAQRTPAMALRALARVASAREHAVAVASRPACCLDRCVLPFESEVPGSQMDARQQVATWTTRGPLGCLEIGTRLRGAVRAAAAAGGARGPVRIRERRDSGQGFGGN